MAKPRILIVEDEKIVAMDLRNTLINIGYDVPAVVVSGRDAIKNTEQIKPDLVLMDIVLKGDIDGVKAAAHIRHCFDIPVIYLTAYADKETLMRAKITEPFGYIIKPFDERELYTAIEMALYRHEMEMLLKKSEEKYRTLTENINIGVYRNTIGQRGKFLEANPAIIKMFGYKDKNEFLAINFADLCQNSKDWIEFNQKMLKNGFIRNEELQLKKKDGTPLIGSVSTVVVKDKKGKARYYDGVIEDITERKQTEEKLLYQADLLENVSDAVISVDVDYKIQSWNRAAERMYGWKAVEVMGKKLYTVIKTEFLDGSRRQILDRLSTREDWFREVIQKRKNGKKIYVFESVSVIRNRIGNLTGAVLINRDITELKLAEKALQESEENYRGLVDNALVGVVKSDVKGNMLYANETLVRMFEFESPKEMVAQGSWMRYKRRGDRKIFLDKLRKNGKVSNYEIEVVTKTGKTKHIAVHATLEGKILSLIVIDITERKQAEEKIKDLAKFLFEDPYPVIRIAKDGMVLYANVAGTILLKEWGCRVGQYVPDQWQQLVVDTLDVGITRETEVRHRNKVFSLSVVPVFEHSYVNLYGIDITERKRTAEIVKRHLVLEKTLVEVSETMIKTKNIDVAVNKMLARLGRIFDVDEVCLFQAKEKEKIWEYTHKWLRHEVKVQKKSPRSVSSKQFSMWAGKLRRRHVIAIPDVNELSYKFQRSIKQFRKQSIKSFLIIPLYSENKFFGALGFFNDKKTRDWREDDISILQAAGEIIASSLIREYYQKQLSKALTDLTGERKRIAELARKTIDVQEKERLYLASEIHDDLLQGLVAVLYFLQMIDVTSLDGKIQERKEKLGEIIKASIERGRALISEIEPIREPEIGLVQAIERSIKLRFAGQDVKVNFTHHGELRKSSFELKANILRIVQEALMNVRKHAKATEIAVKISATKKELKIEIKDNGRGFNPKLALKKTTGHYGLLSMQERARLIGGELIVRSKRRKGTIVKGVFPLDGS